jgi:hypothetical protein
MKKDENQQKKEDPLEAYRARLVKRIHKEAKRHGFTFEHVAKSFSLSLPEKKERSEEWMAYYADCVRAWEKLDNKCPVTTGELNALMTVPRPYFPDSNDYPEYLEYERVDRLIQQKNVSKIEEAFL